MRVLQVVGGLGIGGVERMAAVLSARLHGMGHDVLLVNLGSPGEHADAVAAAGVPVLHLGLSVPRTPRGLLRTVAGVARLWGIILRGRWDVVQTHLFKTAVLASPPARLTGAVVVGGIHGIDPSALQRRLMREVVRLQHAVVAVSGPLADRVVRDLGLPRRKLAVVPNGIEVDGALATAPAPARRHDVDTVVVGCVGRLHERKGQLDLVRAFARAVRREPRARLVLVGDGPLRPRIEQEVTGLGLGDTVVLAGAQPDVAPWLASFDVLVVPSHYEGFNLTAVEGMLARLPVVATAAGGPEEIVEAGTTGLLVPPRDVPALADALVELCRDDVARARMGRAGRDRARSRYLAPAMAEGYAALYHRLRAARR
ncbi:MAG: glycosyltransferase [Actinomycetota bacterium]|nr:glycosyltransferase [Actinomycetota bacterium]